MDDELGDQVGRDFDGRCLKGEAEIEGADHSDGEGPGLDPESEGGGAYYVGVMRKDTVDKEVKRVRGG
jgi:hypothetical protein